MSYQHNALPKLPDNWVWIEVGDLCDAQTGPFGTQLHKADYASSGIPIVEIGDVHPNRNLAEGAAHFVSKDKAEQLTRYAIRNGDILFTRVGTVGRCTKVPSLCNGWLMSTSLIRVRPRLEESISSAFLLYYFWSPIAQSFAKASSKGTTRAGTNSTIVEELPLALAPFKEQKRIVSKVEELFSFLDAGTESLRKVQAQLKRYRQAVLKHAFEGKLTEEWRKTPSGLVKPISKAKNDHSLPAEWVVKPLSEIAEIQMGQSPPGSSYGNSCQGTPLLNGPTEFGVNQPNPKQWTNKPTQVCKNGDLLICVRGNTTGRMNWADQEYCIGRGLASITPIEKISNRFFVYYFLLKEVNEIMRRTTGSTFPNLKSSELKNFELPLPPYDEQNIIVQMIEQSFSIAYNTEKTVQTVLRQANSLRQSILKNAFEGKLIPQDPSDEPAEILLRRIKEQKSDWSNSNSTGLMSYVK